MKKANLGDSLDFDDESIYSNSDVYVNFFFIHILELRNDELLTR